jgi:hypothetical protein
MSFYLEPIDQAALDRLKAIGWGNIQIAELVALHFPAPKGTVVCAMADYDRMADYAGLAENAYFQALTQNPVEARFAEKQFQKVQHGSSVDDSTVTFEFIDDDGVIADLLEQYGEGIRVSILFYFPQVDWLRERWWGLLGAPDEVGGIVTKVPASYGFRAPQSTLPCGTRGAGCRFTYGGQLKTAAEIAENGCRYDRHVGGAHGRLDPATGQPYPTCGHNEPDCFARIGDLREYGGGDTAADTLVVSETKGPRLNATVQGNETNLKSARRVAFGEMKANAMECLESLVEPDTKHPDKGSARVAIDGFEGPIQLMDQCYIYNQFVGIQHLQVRLGTYRQPPTGISPNVLNYNMAAHFYGVIQGDFRGFQPGQFTGSSHVKGLNDIRVYSDPDTYLKQYSTSPPFCILHMLTNKAWGDGRDYARFVIQDWIDADSWCAQMAGFLDAAGNHYTSTRATFNAILEERDTRTQISDCCLFAGLSLPFPFQGKERIMPLTKEADLSKVPVFSDDEDLLASDPTVRPIMFEEKEGSTLRTKKVFSEVKGELPNKIIFTLLDAAHDNVERPLTLNDDMAQLAEGAASGSPSRRIIPREYSGVGVTDFGQAVRAMNRLVDLGEFDQGGLKNNREVTFLADFLDTLDLHKYKVIKVVSKTLERYKQPSSPDKHFEYFRVQDMADEDDLLVRLRGVAYPEDYYEDMEDASTPPPRPGTDVQPNPGGGPGPGDRPFPVAFATLSHTKDAIQFELMLP